MCLSKTHPTTHPPRTHRPIEQFCTCLSQLPGLTAFLPSPLPTPPRHLSGGLAAVMGSNGGTNMGNVQVKVHRGKTPGEMLKWHKRWLVVSGDGLELQLFKNDQEYTPKEVIRVSDVVSVMPGGDTDKKGSTLEITMRKDAKGAQGYSLKVRTQDERNHWLRAVREMREGVWRGADHSSRSNLKDAMDRWRHALSDLRGTDVRLVVDDASVYSLPSADVDRAISFLVEGAWFGPLDKLFRQLKSGGSHAHPVSRVVLVVSTATDASPASFDKVTETLLLRLHWTHEGGVPYLRSPDVASLLSLVVTEIWQLNAERTLVHQPSWKEAVGRLCDIVGKSVPVGLDWAPNIHEDTPDVRSYVHKWASAEYLDAVTNTIIQCFDQHLQAPYQELKTWVGAITLLFSRDDVISRAPPRVRIHRNTVRNDDTGNGPTKALLNAFNKCRGRVLEKYSPVLCEGPVPDLRAHLLHTLNHIHMAELMRTAERITVGFEKLKLNFVINWDSFLASLAHIEASSGARLRLAKELLTKYPARVQTVSKAVSEAEWGVLCGLMHTVSVAFVREGSEERTFLADGDLVDVCFIGLQDKPDGGHCVVMSFDVKDLGSFCRGLLASGEGAAAKRPQSLLRLARNCRSESSEASHSEGSSGSNEVMTAHPSRVLASQQSFRSLDSSSRHKQQTHTQFADDSTMMSYVLHLLVLRVDVPIGFLPVLRVTCCDTLGLRMHAPCPTPLTTTHCSCRDRDLPNEILAKLRQTPLDDEYPVSAQLLEDTIRALNEAFTKQRRALEPESKQSVIIHAVWCQGCFLCLLWCSLCTKSAIPSEPPTHICPPLHRPRHRFCRSRSCARSSSCSTLRRPGASLPTAR